MKNVPNGKFQTIFRAVVLCGVFVGLLFSCGEGIRLFPFPETAKNDSTQLDLQNKISYQFNIHRFEDRQVNHKTKSRHNLPNHYFIASGAFTDSVFRVLAARVKFDFPTAAEDLKLPLFSESGDSRAPPFII